MFLLKQKHSHNPVVKWMVTFYELIIIEIFVACKFFQHFQRIPLALFRSHQAYFYNKSWRRWKKKFPRFARSDTVCGQCASVQHGCGWNERSDWEEERVSNIMYIRRVCTCGKERDYGPRLYSGSGLDDADSTAESQILDRFQGIVRRCACTHCTRKVRARNRFEYHQNVPLYARESHLLILRKTSNINNLQLRKDVGNHF